MENSGKKRVRSVNFSCKEKEVLISLVLKYKHIVENKKTDQVSVAEKVQAWGKITEEFNALSPNLCERSTDSLKKIYDNKKKEVRKQVAEEKREIFLTGGGKKKEVQTDPNQDVLLSIMNSKTVFGLENPFDSDKYTCVRSNLQDNSTEFELGANFDWPLVDETVNIQPPEPDSGADEEFGTENQGSLANDLQQSQPSSSQIQWKKASSLRTPLSENLKRPHNVNDSDETPSTRKRAAVSSNRRRPKTTVRALSSSHLAEKYEQLLDKRLLIADYEKKKLENELEFQKEQFKLKIELLEIQIKLEKKKLQATQ